VNPRAVIDVGSHSVLLLVAEETEKGPRVLLEDYRISALGTGLGQTGLIDPEATARTKRIIVQYLERCRDLGAKRILPVGTSALREADNREQVLLELSQSAGQPIRVLSRREEAGLTRRGALSSLSAGDDALVVDLGGRSTEMTWPGFSRSIPIGCQRGTEDILATDPPTDTEMAELRDRVRSHLPAPPDAGALVFSGGTATTLASMDLARPAMTRSTDMGTRCHHQPALPHVVAVPPTSAYRPDLVHGHRMSPARLDDLIQMLSSVPLAERKNLAGIEPERAGVLVAGSIILDELCRWCRRESFLVSARGLTWGVWLAHSA
jgi:exopolyphosphatase/guanosine-5'-triphosphate,3'-diphosphate pyrophosphatase